MAKYQTNPNGANQFSLDPRQKICWEAYTNPKSRTFGNATQSAIKAGYTEGYADEVSQSEWFCAKLWKLNSVNSAEKKFKEILELPTIDEKNKVDTGILKIQADIAKFLASTQGKEEGYTTRQEHTGKDGGLLFSDEAKEKAKKAIADFEE